MQMTLIQETLKNKYRGGLAKKIEIFFAILRISLAYQFLVQKKNSNSPALGPTFGTKPNSSIPPGTGR
jgi:hypothetical protein